MPQFKRCSYEKGCYLTVAISVLILGVCQSTVGGTLSPKVDDASSDTDPHPSASLIDSNSPLGVVKQTYAAFGRGDIPAILNLIADQVDWQDVCPASLPYSGLRRNRAEVAKFFSDEAQVEEVKAFEAREFIAAGENVTVLGYIEGYARDTKQEFRTDWIHLFTVQNGKITRWRGFLDTAARYGW
jgi:ketosteroid isomerase-like protein